MNMGSRQGYVLDGYVGNTARYFAKKLIGGTYSEDRSSLQKRYSTSPLGRLRVESFGRAGSFRAPRTFEQMELMIIRADGCLAADIRWNCCREHTGHMAFVKTTRFVNRRGLDCHNRRGKIKPQLGTISKSSNSTSCRGNYREQPGRSSTTSHDILCELPI
jgi:hypothetical protein